jgi:hypothetical protein
MIRFFAGAQESPQAIESPGGGAIAYGQLAGQPHDAGGNEPDTLPNQPEIWRQPQVGRILKNSTGEVLAAFFHLTAKLFQRLLAESGRATWATAPSDRRRFLTAAAA